MKAYLVALAVATALAPAAVRAQQPMTAESKSVVQAVEQFLDDLGNRRVDKLAAQLLPKGALTVVRQRDGKWTASSQTFDEWMASMKAQTGGTTFREPLTNVSVNVESGQLAHVRADFTVVADGQVRSHGVDYFTLARDGDQWKMANVAYTSLPGAP